jgi:diguanylate cyclase (GGDEF)-like protein
VVGRYGGEEFALILPDTPGDNARYVLEDIRRRFNKITHLAGDQFFSVSFSAGIASYPEYTTANDLKEAADQALYQSKHAGRDCVSLIRPALPEIYKAEK